MTEYRESCRGDTALFGITPNTSVTATIGSRHREIRSGAPVTASTVAFLATADWSASCVYSCSIKNIFSEIENRGHWFYYVDVYLYMCRGDTAHVGVAS